MSVHARDFKLENWTLQWGPMVFSGDSLYLSGAQPERFGTTPDLSDGCHQRGTGENRSNDHWSRTTSFNLGSKEPPDKSNAVHVEASENALYHGQIHLNLDRWIILMDSAASLLW